MSFEQYDEVYYGPDIGTLRISASGLGWRPIDESKKGQVITVADKEIRSARWTRVARNFQLRIETPSGMHHKFEGLSRDDHDRLASLLRQYYNKQLENYELSVRGWNWGNVDARSQDIVFYNGGRPAFHLPTSAVSNTIISKAEVTLEFALNNNNNDQKPKKAKKSADEFVEIRFYIPGMAKKKNMRENGGADEMDVDEHEADDDEEDEEKTAAELFHDLIREKSSAGEISGVPIVSFPEVLCTIPRGRYDIDMYTSFFRLRSRSYDYKINYSQVQRLYMLPKSDEIHVNVIINLDPPIRQGQTRYPYLTLQFTKEEEMSLTPDLDDEEAKAAHPDLQAEYDAPAYEVVSNIVQVMTRKRLLQPSNYHSRTGQSSVKCNLKAIEGHMYFLDRSLFFSSKQPVNIFYSDIQVAKFERVGGAMASSRTFDLKISTASSGPDMTFSSLAKEDHPSIEEFLKDKKVRVRNLFADEQAMVAALSDGDDDDSSGGEGRSKKEKGKSKAANDDDDDDESDDDFKAESESDDLAEEFDSDAEGSSSASEEEDAGQEDEEMDEDDEDDEDAKGDDDDDDDDTRPPKAKKSKH